MPYIVGVRTPILSERKPYVLHVVDVGCPYLFMRQNHFPTRCKSWMPPHPCYFETQKLLTTYGGGISIKKYIYIYGCMDI